MPKIIGKGGHTIQALRTLLNASAERHGIKANLEIVE
ncbi:MAG: KH domain-containing protein [Terrimicrobiaceae bacterium]